MRALPPFNAASAVQAADTSFCRMLNLLEHLIEPEYGRVRTCSTPNDLYRIFWGRAAYPETGRII
jgi:hypothetical protein